MKITLNKKQKKKQLLDNEEIYKIMKEILLREDKLDREKKHFWIMGLNRYRQLLYVELVRLGPFSRKLTAHEAFKIAIDKEAKIVILVQNKEEDEPLHPSPFDLDMTDHLIQIGKIIKINVSDHLIIQEDGQYKSFVDIDLYESLLNSRKYVPITTLEDKARKRGERVGKTRGINERNIEIAESMIKDNIDNTIIA